MAKKRIAVVISGRGSNLLALIQAAKQPDYPAEISLVLSDRAEATGLSHARAAGIERVTVFTGERPASDIPAYLGAANVLVSPRSRGTNTPLKIYQYLRSGKPIVATRLLTHTQVLSDQTAILTGISPREFAGGILAAIGDPDRAAAVGRRARDLAETKYSYEAYLERTRQACAALLPSAAPRVVAKDLA